MTSSTKTETTTRILLAPVRARAPRRLPAATGSSAAGMRRRPWLARLRRAIERDLFVLHFQPIASLRDGQVSHYEALLRLADEPGGALTPPNAFLPAAERYGLIRHIDRLVLEKAVRLLAEHVSAGGGAMRVAINLSAMSVTDADMLAAIERTLARHGVEPARLALELTETSAISDIAQARAFCAGALELGCRVALDDFGAGFGSFHYLKHLPFSELKIDGAFIRRLPSSRTDQLIVRSLAGIARGMGRETIAEFVGDRPTIGMLRGYGVDYAQGFEVGRPGPLLPRELPTAELVAV
jgi:EAL domain-containing protein (putative c-di-GMP-specific phosphodiesterase class I)